MYHSFHLLNLTVNSSRHKEITSPLAKKSDRTPDLVLILQQLDSNNLSVLLESKFGSLHQLETIVRQVTLDRFWGIAVHDLDGISPDCPFSS